MSYIEEFAIVAAVGKLASGCASFPGLSGAVGRSFCSVPQNQSVVYTRRLGRSVRHQREKLA